MELPAQLDAARPVRLPVRQALCAVSLGLGDLAAVAIAMGAAMGTQAILRRWWPLENLNHLTQTRSALFLFSVVALGGLLQGAYSRREPLWEAVRRSVSVAIAAVVATVGALYLLKVAEITPRSFILLAGANLLVLAPAARALTIAALRRTGLWDLRSLLVAERSGSESLARELEADWALGFKVAAILEPARGQEELRRLAAEVDQVVVSAADFDPSALARAVSAAQQVCPSVVVIPDLKGIAFVRAETKTLFESQRLLLTTRNLLLDPVNRALKRTFDLCVGGLLLLLALPALLVVALLVRLDSRGPALFVQKRMGRGGRPFPFLKFRTMRSDAEKLLADVLASDPEKAREWKEHFKLRDDPRVTRLGAFLRRTSIDELPQLLNVVLGHMSLVGPRPLPDYHHEELVRAQGSGYLAVPPGITGLWQVSGRADAGFEKMAAFNDWYVRNWSLWLDFTILLRTVPVVFRGRGAY